MEDIMSRIPVHYRADVQRGITILKEAGCKEVYLFGSLAKGDIRKDSDIDLAVRGCPSGMYFHVLGKLMIELNHPVDLVDLDKEDDFAQHIEKRGGLIYVS